MLKCREATRLLSEAQERRLGLLERLNLRTHLWLCDACSSFGVQLGVLREAMRRYAHRQDDPGSHSNDRDSQ